MNGDQVDDGYEAQLRSAAALLRRTLRCWRSGLVVFGLGAAACAAFLFVRKPTFRSETVILYSEGVGAAGETERTEEGRGAATRLKEILLSRASLDAVGRQYGLYQAIREARGPVDAAEELKRHIEFRAPGGDTFSLAFTGSSPMEARDVTAHLAELLIAQDAELRRKQGTAIRDFLETERSATTAELRSAELALASFMAAHPRFALDTTPFATGAAVRATLGLSQATPTPGPSHEVWVDATHVARSSGPQEATHLDTGAIASSLPAYDRSASAAREARAEEHEARTALDSAQANLAILAARFTSAHPDVRAAQAEVDRASVRLAAARDAASAAEDHEPVAATAPPQPASPAPITRRVLVRRPSANSARGSAPKASASEQEIVTLETEWVKLTHAATEARQHQDQVEAALFKAGGAAQAQKGDGVQVTVIDPAFLPQSPVPPGRALIIMLFVGAALLMASLVSFLRGLLDDHVYEARDVEPLLPVLVAIPRRRDVKVR